jgi:hypothetical protein
VAKHVRRKLGDVGRDDVATTAEECQRPRSVDEVDRAAGAGAIRDVRPEVGEVPAARAPGRVDESDRVVDDPRVDVDVGDARLEDPQAVRVTISASSAGLG